MNFYAIMPGKPMASLSGDVREPKPDRKPKGIPFREVLAGMTQGGNFTNFINNQHASDAIRMALKLQDGIAGTVLFSAVIQYAIDKTMQTGTPDRDKACEALGIETPIAESASRHLQGQAWWNQERFANDIERQIGAGSSVRPPQTGSEPRNPWRTQGPRRGRGPYSDWDE